MSYVPIQELLAILYDASPTKVDAITFGRRRIDYGLLPVGLKVHCLDSIVAKQFEGLWEQLEKVERIRNLYRREQALFCLVLPPVANARTAIMLLEAIEQYTGAQIFNNRAIQIQVCTPGRIPNRYAAVLTVGFYLGSDILRGYKLDDLETTFSDSSYLPRGRRITLYDGQGDLEKDFDWWLGNGHGTPIVQTVLPFKNERTDVLTCTRRLDIHNVNLLATLMVHLTQGWYWRKLGGRLERDAVNLLDEHLLSHLLDARWIRRSEAAENEDESYIQAVRELMVYAMVEATRLTKDNQQNGILYQISNLLNTYRAELMKQALGQPNKGDT